MKFRFCGDADCPDWILSEINVLSRLSSIKVKLMAQIVVQGMLHPPVEMTKAEKIFADAKLDTNSSIKGCMSCLLFILTSTVRFSCDNNALHSELQQLGLPREHSLAIRKIVEEYSVEIKRHLNSNSLKINPLTDVNVKSIKDNKFASIELTINGSSKTVMVTPYTLNVLLNNLKAVRATMEEIQKNPIVL